jgi:hypothetical protein
VAVCLVAGAVGVSRFRREVWRRSFEGMCGDAALVFLAAGGIAVALERMGTGQFSRATAAVAVHLHYGGFLLPLLAGLVQRELFFLRLAARAAVGVVLGVPAVVAGIVAMQMGWGSSLYTAAACGLALAGMAVGVLQVRIASDGRQPPLTRALLGVSGAALFLAMALVAAQAMRGVPVWVLDAASPIDLLLAAALAPGFGGCGVLAWRRLNRDRPTV